jgi:hypothetical protein
MQTKLGFGFDPLVFQEVKALGLKKYHKFSVFRTFFLLAFKYSIDICYIALPYRDTDQFRVWF